MVPRPQPFREKGLGSPPNREKQQDCGYWCLLLVQGKDKSQTCADDPADAEEQTAMTAAVIEVLGKQPHVLQRHQSPAVSGLTFRKREKTIPRKITKRNSHLQAKGRIPETK